VVVITAERPRVPFTKRRYGNLGFHPRHSLGPSPIPLEPTTSISSDPLQFVTHLAFLHTTYPSPVFTMGINPDAYMSGAIPGLSRGGSWQNVQDPYPSPHNPMQQGGGSIYPRPSQIVPPGSSASGTPRPGMGNRSNSHFAHHHPAHHPWAMNNALPQSPLSHGFAPSYQQSYFPGMVNGSQGSSTGYSASMVSGKAPLVGPTRHPGWINGQYNGSQTSAPTSPTVHSGRNTPRSVHLGPTPPRSATSKHPPASNPAQLQSPSSAGGFAIHPQHEWEWASGSPKPMTAEADYFSKQSPVQNEKYYKPTPAHSLTPPPSARVMTLRLPEKRRSKTVEALPPPPQSGRLRHESMRQAQQNQRPTPLRRHTHDRFSSEDMDQRPSKHDSKSLGRPRRKERDVGSVAGESYYAPSKSSSMPRSHHPAAPHSHSPRAGSRRTESLLSTSQVRATSLTERRLKQTGRPALPTIVSASTGDFTASDPSVAQSARPDRSALDLSRLADALPSAPITATPGPYTAASGYAPTEEEEGDYDRYMAHPAVPTPSRKEVTAPPMRMDVKIVKPEDYRPPAFPAPTKPRPWNRDGPAMKTHGVAWGREAPEGQLPTGPAGPRWAQARPPRLDIQQTGNWWESGVG
jgi:hypothetical protein